MEKISGWIVNHKKIILSVFFVSLIICIITSQGVKVNYDMNDYLPEDSKSTIALEVMSKEFKGGIPNARIMVSDVSISEALEIKEKLLNVKGVTDITWLDDVVSLETPIEIADTEIVREYYKENKAIFTATIEEEKQISAVNEIRELIGDDNSMSGSAVNTVMATQTTSKEVSRIIFILIPVCLLILFLTSTSWIEPILFMLAIGVAIVLNSGTNLLFGEISFVTSAAANILQLAVSMDYSIFLLHRFAEFREEGLEAKEAMVQALSKSVTSIASSGLTTVIGFAALIIMKFKIGPDMGIVMAKATLFSLITVLVLLPVIVLYSYKLIDKTRHKSYLPSFKKFSKFVYRIKTPMIILFLLLIIPGYLGQGKNTFNYGASKIFTDEATQLVRDTQVIEKYFAKSNPIVLLVPKGDLAKEKLLSDEFKEIPEVKSIISYVDTVGAEIPIEYLEENITSNLISDNYSRIIVNTNIEYEGDKAFDIVEDIRNISSKYYGEDYYLVGETIGTYDLMDVITSDNQKVNFIAIAAVFIVLMISFKSLSIPLILVLAIETAIWINLSVPYFGSSPLFYIGYLIISSVQLGATVDYAILLSSRYIEYREEYQKKEAILMTMESTTISILTSASILTISGFLLGYISTNGVISQLGQLIGRGTVFSTMIVLFVIPGLLYFLDGIIQKTTYKTKFVNMKGEEKKYEEIYN